MSNIVPIKTHKPRPLRALKKFSEDADMLVAAHDELDELLDKTKAAADRLKNADEVAALFERAKKLAALGQSDRQRIERCNRALEQFDPAGSYENDDRESGLCRSVITERLALMVGSFPNGAPSDPKAYATTMIENVCTIEGLTLPALDAAVWQIIGTAKFLPVVTEVVAEVNAQQAKWDERTWAMHDVLDKSRRILTKLDALDPKLMPPSSRAPSRSGMPRSSATSNRRGAPTQMRRMCFATFVASWPRSRKRSRRRRSGCWNVKAS